MSVTREDVSRVARLARLQLEEAELERFTRELSDILSHIDALSELEVDAVDEAASAGAGNAAPLRSDDSVPDALALPPSELAPEWKDGFILVPRLAAHDQGEGA